jgi:hypothetical protein
MMRNRTGIAAGIALFTAAFLLTGCEEKTAEISGTIYSFHTVNAPTFVYAPLPAADVALIEGSAKIDTQATDAAGAYSFARVDPGTYTIRAYMGKVADPDLGASRDRVGSGSWEVPSDTDWGPPAYVEYSGLTVAAGDEVTVDFRLAGY